MGAEEQGNPFLPPDGPEKSKTPETEERGVGGGGQPEIAGKNCAARHMPIVRASRACLVSAGARLRPAPGILLQAAWRVHGVGKFGFPAAAWALPCPVPFSSLACFRCSPY